MGRTILTERDVEGQRGRGFALRSMIDTASVLHDLGVMARNLKNVTVTLDPETARWARVEAAKQETSVSRFLGEILRREMEGGQAYEQAMDRFLSQAPGIHRRDRGPLPSREEIHDRPGLR